MRIFECDELGDGPELGGSMNISEATLRQRDKDAFDGGFEAGLGVAKAAPELYDAVNALLGLIQLVSSRDDMPAEIKHALETNHRVEEAKAALSKADEGGER